MKIISIKALLIMLACLETSFASCQDKIIKIEQVRKNPTEYVFNAQKDSLYRRIFSKLKVTNMMLFDAIHKNMVLGEISDLFSQSADKLDFCLMPVYYIGKSMNYKRENGGSLDYEAWFYLHLETIDEEKTKVSITTIEPKIIVGKELLPTPPHFVRKDKTMLVEPSTIEEYEILLDIGKLAGEKNMPPINLPEKK